MVQKFIKEADGKDLRCFMIVGKVVTSIERQAAPVNLELTFTWVAQPLS